MNKVYKSKLNESTGQYVAVSETTKGDCKSSSSCTLNYENIRTNDANTLKLSLLDINKNKLKALIVSAISLLGAVGLSNVAFAGTCSDASGVSSSSGYSCSGLANDDETVTISNSTYTTSSSSSPMEPIYLTTSGLGVADLTIENVGASFSGDTGAVTSGIHVHSAAGASIKLKGNNTVNLSGNVADTGILIDSPTTAGATGHSILSAEGILNVTVNNSVLTESDGVEVNNHQNGSSILSHTGIGKIDVTGGRAVYVRNGGSQGDAVAVLQSASANGIELITHTNNKSGLYISTEGSNTVGNTIVNSNAKITTYGHSSNGIDANNLVAGSTGNIVVNNSGSIETFGPNAHAIYVVNLGKGATSVVTSGNIHAKDGFGILVQNIEGNAEITNTANITVEETTVGNYVRGIEIYSRTGTVTVNHNGTLKVKAVSANSDGIFGIAVWDANSGTSGNQTINIGSGAVVDASEAGTALYMSNGSPTSKNIINIGAAAQVHGGSFASIQTAGAIQEVNNEGVIDALSDRAINMGSTISGGGDLVINNSGIITGYMVANPYNTTVNNTGTWNVRNFSDTDHDGTRDAKAVAVNNFIVSGANTTFNNQSGGVVSLAAVSGEASVNNAGEYVPMGALSITNAGIVQGQMLNLNTFENSGLIDMTANNQAGDVFVITGGGTAGVNGGGTFISNGGSLKLNTLLNEGGAASQTDMLVLDNVKVGGNGATKVYISPAAGSLGAYTPGDGIKIIETSGTQDASAFTLGQPLLSGAYEYQLFAYDTAGNQNGFYLRSQLNNDPLYNPNIGSYLGNQYATSTMFNQNILDRRNSVRSTDKNIWMRTNYNETRYDQLGGRQHTKIDNTLAQLGIDIIRYQDFTAGAYIGYGQSRTRNHSNQTGTRGNAKANGYQVGIYGTWMPDENQGPYVDTWAHYAWYKNRLEGQAQQNDNVKYDSHGYAFSVEAGYGFNLATTQSGRMWIIQPHAQIIYNNLKTKDFTDNNYTYFANQSASGISTRVGARFYGQEPAGQQGVLPFVEANWLYNGVKGKVKLGGRNFDEKVGQNVGELKFGINGQVNNKISVFGHLGGQLGSHDYKRGEVQIGLSVNW